MQGKNPHIVYKFFHDPAHGWLEVPLSELLDLEIADKISTYSYKSELRGMAYLEEDCDLTVFLNAIGYYGDSRAFFENHVDHEYLPHANSGRIPHYIRNCESY